MILLIALGGVEAIYPLCFVSAADSPDALTLMENSAADDLQNGEDFSDDLAFDEDWESELEKGPEAGGSTSLFTWRIDAAIENYINTRQELHFIDASVKNEVSARLECRYGLSDSYLFSVTHVYFFPTFFNEDIGEHYPYVDDSETYRNLRISSDACEFMPREFYYNWQRGSYRIRIGNQLFSWGTADFMNSTQYFNPPDLRELMFIDEDEARFGVPAVSGMVFFDRFTLEMVFVPLHVEEALPVTNSFWAVKEVEDAYPLIFDESQHLSAKMENFGYGARISSTWEGIDFSLSGYHGPDRDQVLVPFRTVLEENQTVSVMIRPQAFMVDYVGFDFAWTYEDFVFQAEAAYSPNKRGFIEQDTDRPQDLEFPYDTTRTDYLSYSLGFNYFIPLHKLIPDHAGDTLFTVEWYQAQYFEDEINPPEITDILTCRFQDDYFDKRINLSLTAVIETRNSGYVLWPQIGYDFKNGFKLELAYVGIRGQGEGDYEKDSLFYYYESNDFIMVNLRYAYP